MTEKQDVLAEALHDLDNENGHDYKNPAHRRAHNIDAFAILARLSARGYALVRTPETLDAERLAIALERAWPRTFGNRMSWSQPSWEMALAVARQYAAIPVALSSPTPPEGLRKGETCSHSSVVGYEFTDGQPGDLWACAACMRRFYPACSTCVDVGHRNVVHPAASPAPDPGADQ